VVVNLWHAKVDGGAAGDGGQAPSRDGSDLATHRDLAERAAGSALARNPVPVLIPCHRVVLSDGNEGHYLFGAELKRRLLMHEDANLEEARRLAATGARYLGSDTTGVVCYPSCHHARRIAPGHRVGFRSLAHALASGYRACRHCRPAGAPAT
jgi:O-6-methylguanine DNA methyltransferase